jgi:hypothetical protein
MFGVEDAGRWSLLERVVFAAGARFANGTA